MPFHKFVLTALLIVHHSDMQSRSEKLECTQLNGKPYEYLNKYFTHALRSGYVKCKNTVLPQYFQEGFGSKIQEMDVRPDDIWVVSFPKTGTTWTQEMVWCMANNLDFEAAKIKQFERFPFLDSSMILNFRSIESDDPDIFPDSFETVNKFPSPRFIKTHLPFQLLPKQLQTSTTVKIIYVTRNPGDACVSYYHHSKTGEGYKGGFDEFCELFLEGKVTYAPFWDHVMGYWSRRNNSNLLILKYEDMKKDLRSVILRTANFLDKNLTEEQVEKLLDHLSFESMKNNLAVNGEGFQELYKRFNLCSEDADSAFIRSGKVGDWRNAMKSELRERFAKWIKENSENIGITFEG